MPRLTKIVATIGPASEKEEVLKQIFPYVDVFRLNFSHGSLEEHKRRAVLVRKLEKEFDTVKGLLLDTKGPEIRVGKLKGEIFLKEGQLVTIKYEDIIGDEKAFSISYKDLYKYVDKGDRILLDDGLIELEVVEVKGKDIICRVKNSGYLSSNKSVNVPDKELDMPFLSEKDKQDIKFGKEMDFDFLALSFVRSAKDIKETMQYLKEIEADNYKIIAKIESKQALRNLEEIIDLVDGVMVARGDLGVEIPIEEVPIWQKKIIKLAKKKKRFTIVATQMLESMTKNPRPTRAEASDVINAVLDGTDAVMLSGETAKGKYPVESVKMMDKLVREAEKLVEFSPYKIENYTEFVAKSVVNASYELPIKAIISPSRTGYTPSLVSNFRPRCVIYSFVPTDKIRRWLTIRFGVYPYRLPKLETMFEVIEHNLQFLKEKGLLNDEDLVAFAIGTQKKRTNTLIIDLVKELLHSVKLN